MSFIERWIERFGKRKAAAAGTAVLLAVIGIAAAVAGYGKDAPAETTETVTESETQAEIQELSSGEQTLLDSIWDAMEQENYPAAAAILIKNESQLWTLLDKTLAGEICLYDGEQMHRTVEGKGMVFRKAGTLFFGEFKDGKPEGQCQAIQAVVLDAPRYDYSIGVWKNGKMEGEGIIGYDYYEGIQGGLTRETQKEGMFREDLMEGDLIYTSVNAEGTIPGLLKRGYCSG
ncbi:MAG: hypothetical protein ACLTKI_01065 [Lachnospiraceae bacterium]